MKPLNSAVFCSPTSTDVFLDHCMFKKCIDLVLHTGQFVQIYGSMSLHLYCINKELFIPVQLRLKPVKASKVIVACAILHNLAINLKEPDVDGPIPAAQQPNDDYRGREEGTAVRDHIIAYFA